MKLPSLEVLSLVGCVGIDDDALASLEKECTKSLQVLIELAHFVSPATAVSCHLHFNVSMSLLG